MNKLVGFDKYDARVVVKNLPDRATVSAWEKLNAARLKSIGNTMGIHIRP